MTSLREAREAAYWLHWRQSLRENPRDGLPAFLDALEEIDREQVPDGIIAAKTMTDEEAAEFARQWNEDAERGHSSPRAPSDAEIAAWIEAHPAEFERWVARQNRINGTTATSSRTPARRRTAPKGGTT